MCDQHSTVLVEVHGAEPRGHLGSMRAIDACIAPLVNALNWNGFPTLASCCGHGKRPGNIALADGRELLIAPDYDTARLVEVAFAPLNEPTGDRMTAVDIARLRSAVEILGSMVVGGHLMMEASQESMREKANEIMADLLAKTWDPHRGQWKSVNERTDADG